MMGYAFQRVIMAPYLHSDRLIFEMTSGFNLATMKNS